MCAARENALSDEMEAATHHSPLLQERICDGYTTGASMNSMNVVWMIGKQY